MSQGRPLMMKVIITCAVFLWVCGLVSAQQQDLSSSPGPGDTKPVQATTTETAAAPNEVETAAQSVPEALPMPSEGDEAVRLQIFLDQQHFGPGFIDGKPGMFTKLAVENYNTSKGRPKDDLRVVAESVQSVRQVYATAIVPGFVDQFVDPTLPGERSLQAERSAMPYRSVAEFMAERYHTSEDLLLELNGTTAVWSAKARAALRVPNIEPFKIEDLTHGKSHKRDEHLSARYVVVDTGVRQVYIHQLVVPTPESAPEVAEAGQGEDAGRTLKLNKPTPVLMASFPITPGKIQFIPRGFWNLKNSVELPEWRYDQLLLDTGVRGKDSLAIPPGPNNPVGVIWNGLTKSGIGIHGTDNPRTIGRAHSSGCIRLSNWDAARIPKLVRPGAVVMVK